jgi:hypothetical protein
MLKKTIFFSSTKPSDVLCRHKLAEVNLIRSLIELQTLPPSLSTVYYEDDGAACAPLSNLNSYVYGWREMNPQTLHRLQPLLKNLSGSFRRCTMIKPLNSPIFLKTQVNRNTVSIQGTNPVTNNFKPLPFTLLNHPPQKLPINAWKTPPDPGNQFIQVNKPLIIHRQTLQIMPENITNILADLNPQITLHNETSRLTGCPKPLKQHQAVLMFLLRVFDAVGCYLFLLFLITYAVIARATMIRVAAIAASSVYPGPSKGLVLTTKVIVFCISFPALSVALT